MVDTRYRVALAGLPTLPWRVILCAVAFVACSASASQSMGTRDAASDAPVDSSDATSDCAPPACDLAGDWTWRAHLTQCGSDPSDRTVTITGPGSAPVFVVDRDGVRATGTLCGNGVRVEVGYDRAIPAGLTYSGTVDATCRHMSGTLGGECVTDTWSADRQ